MINGFYERKYRRDLALNTETLNTETPSAYLGVIFHEQMDFNTAAEVLSKSGGQAMIFKIHKSKDVGFNTFFFKKNYFIFV